MTASRIFVREGGDILPTHVTIRSGTRDPMEVLRNMGIVPIEEPESHGLLQRVQLTNGWHIRKSDRVHWFDLVDHKGRIRAEIFCRDDLGDGGPKMWLSCRFTIESKLVTELISGVMNTVRDTNTGHAIFESPIITSSHDERPAIANQEARKCATDWLNQHYPDWQDPGAYWDD